MNAVLHPAHRHTIFAALLACSIVIAASLLPLSGAEAKGKKTSTKGSAEATPKPKKSSAKSTASSTSKPKASTTAEKKSAAPKSSSKAKATPKKSNSEDSSAETGKKSTKTGANPSPSKKEQDENAGQPAPALPMKEGSGDEASTSAAGTVTPPAEPPNPVSSTPSEPAAPSAQTTQTPAAPDAPASKEEDDEPATVKKGKIAVAPNVSLAPEDLLGFELQPARVQQLIKNALDLARQKLTYTFGSADPANGGMDCSGAIHYLLTSQGFKDVPRDASGQYVWARKHGQFFAVVSKKADSFEFGDLLPGDLLFWNGTYNVQRDPPVTHTMIYLGVQRKRAQHVMWGSSDGRTYESKPRWGVSVFDFKMPRVDRNVLKPAKADFLGYARIPGLRE